MTDLEQSLAALARGLEKLLRTTIREELANLDRDTPSRQAADWLDEKALATRLGISRITLQSWRYSATGPPFTKIGRLVRYRASDVAAWVEKQRRGGSVEPRSAQTTARERRY